MGYGPSSIPRLKSHVRANIFLQLAVTSTVATVLLASRGKLGKIFTDDKVSHSVKAMLSVQTDLRNRAIRIHTRRHDSLFGRLYCPWRRTSSLTGCRESEPGSCERLDDRISRLSSVSACVSSAQIHDVLTLTVSKFEDIIGYYAVGLPVGYYLAFKVGRGLEGLWVGQAVELLFYFFRMRWVKEVKRSEERGEEHT
jgi:hypothetical protein